MKQKLFITGVSGFIGRHIAKEAVKRGYDVSGIDIVDFPLREVEIDFHKADIRDGIEIEKIIGTIRPDFVIHLAAITNNVPFQKFFESCYKVNVDGFINVIDSAAKHGCKKFVYASSSAVYLEGYSEETKIDIKKQKNHYAKSKIINELIADSYAAIYKDMGIIGLRYFNTYGPTGEEKGDTACIINVFIKNKRDGQPIQIFGDGKQARDFIYVDDVANLTLGILEKGEESIYNVGTGKAVPFIEIAKLIDKKNIEHVPLPLPKDQYQLYTKADTKRLLNLFPGYEFVDIKEGTKRSDFINVAILGMAKQISGIRNDFSEYEANLTTTMQGTITGRVDLTYALDRLGQNDIKALLYVNSFFKRKVAGLAKRDYNIIHITSQELGFAAKILKEHGTKAKIVTTIQDVARLEDQYHPGTLQAAYSNLVKSSIGEALEYSDHIIFSSRQTYSDLMEKKRFKKEWDAIPLGITNEFAFTPTPKAHKPSFIVGYVGPFVYHKNPLFVLKTAERLPGFSFVLYGEGAEHDNMERYRHEKRLKNVVFRRAFGRSDALKEYDSFDAFIYPSLYEGFGLQIIEAQARGIPVIIHEKAKIPAEVAKYCLRAKDEVDAARILANLKKNGYGSKARKEAMQYARNFTWTSTAIKTLDVYRKLLGE